MRFKRDKLTEKERIRKRFEEINEAKNKLNKELDELREKCPHDNKKVGYLANGSYFDITQICMDCGKVLGPITELNIRDI